MMIVHVVTVKVEEAAPAAAAAAAAPAAPAEPEVIKKGKTGEGRRESGEAEMKIRRIGRHEADRRSRQSRAGVPGTRHNVGFDGGGPAGRAAWRELESAPAEALIGEMAGGGHAARQAADVHESQRPGGARSAAVLQDRDRRTCS